MVVHICNLSYSGGWRGSITSLRPAWATQWGPISKQNFKSWKYVTQLYTTLAFNPQYQKKKGKKSFQCQMFPGGQSHTGLRITGLDPSVFYAHSRQVPIPQFGPPNLAWHISKLFAQTPQRWSPFSPGILQTHHIRSQVLAGLRPLCCDTLSTRRTLTVLPPWGLRLIQTDLLNSGVTQQFKTYLLCASIMKEQRSRNSAWLGDPLHALADIFPAFLPTSYTTLWSFLILFLL